MRFQPKLLSTLKNYSKELFYKDLMAGIIVGIVALPLAIAFGIASGVTPEKGLFTAIIAGFIISFLGGSKVQIGGPTGAFIVIVYGIVQEFGVTGLAIATMIAGVILIAMGLLKLGSVIPLIRKIENSLAIDVFAGFFIIAFGHAYRRSSLTNGQQRWSCDHIADFTAKKMRTVPNFTIHDY